MKKTLHPHQQKAIDMLKDSLRSGKKRPIVQAPTGFGKTVLASAIVQGCLDKNKRVMFVVPAISLIKQTLESFYRDGIYDIGVIQANHELTDWAKPVQICSIDTLKNKTDLPHADLVIIDECHRMSDFRNKWMEKWNLVPFVGLSATPWSKGLGKYFDDLIIAGTTQEMIDAGFLSPFRVFAPSQPDLSSVRTVAGDYDKKQLGVAMDKEPLVADIVKTWKERGENRPTLCFAVNRAHAKHIQNLFLQGGVTCGYVDAYTEIDDRDIVAKKFNDGELSVVVNVGCLTTGIDWDVRSIILARPTKSEMLFTQMIGRGLRIAEGKKDCLVLDHSNTHTNLGFVTDIHHDELDDGKPKKKSEAKKKEAPLPKICPKCTYLKPPKCFECPSCGFKPEKQSDIEVVPGQLIEITRKKQKASINKKTLKEDKQKVYSTLLYVAQKNDYSQGWASHKYRSMYGVWPNALEKTIKNHPDVDIYEGKKHG